MNFQNNINIVVVVNNLLGTRLKGMGRTEKGVAFGILGGWNLDSFVPG
jgi:hypothetical protein